MMSHPPYTEADWQHEMAGKGGAATLACPDCGSAADYGPRWHTRPDGTERRYRACKNCGFWQEAESDEENRCDNS
jgi:predicted RNA-binding Zn-ribbon protein involved in translation (DUF1610 family)